MNPASTGWRSFLAGFAGALLATVLVLWTYDRFVLQPREAERRQRIELDVAQGRTEVQQIARGLDESVGRSLDRARAGLDAMAGEQDKARLAQEAIARGSMYRVALSEYYMSNGRWPANHNQAGIAAFDPTTGGAVSAIDLDDRGVVTIALREPFGAGSRFVLTPHAGSDGMVQWQCRSEGDVELRRYVPACAP